MRLYHYQINLYLNAQADIPSFAFPTSSLQPFSQDVLGTFLLDAMRSLGLTFVEFASAQSLDGTDEYYSVCNVSRLSESSSSSV